MIVVFRFCKYFFILQIYEKRGALPNLFLSTPCSSTMAKRGIKYKDDYVTHWENQGEYGRIRVLRMRIRKQKRFDKIIIK